MVRDLRHHDVEPAPLPGGGRPAAPVTVTRMRGRHLDGVLAIERKVYPRPWSPSLLRSELRQRGTRRYLVALDGRLPGRRRVVGYAGLLVQVGEAHVTTVAVHPAEHRRKIASRLLVRLLSQAIAMAADSATLEVRTTNPGAVRLYERFGFVSAGVRPGYYAETGEDALVMWAHGLLGEDFAARLAGVEAELDLPGGSSGAADLAVPWVRGRVGLGGSSVEDEE
ncbi:MAG: ribosomal protein S18-alanine N-acetyltransferase [Euzebyales bacterium]|nr:ribosomal protein S18-alanine N-acetyltransferase [Euzebyales bacterium]